MRTVLIIGHTVNTNSSAIAVFALRFGPDCGNMMGNSKVGGMLYA